MATVLDKLIVEFALDPRQFTQGQKEILTSMRRLEEESIKRGRTVERETEKFSQSLLSMKREAIGLLTVFLGGRGIKEFVGYITNLDAATGRSARTLNMSARELSTWQGAAIAVGGTAAGMTGALQGMSGALNTFALTGQGAFLPVLNRLGISLYNQNRQLKTAGELMMDFAEAHDRLSAEGMDEARQRSIFSLFPGMTEDSINLIMKGRSALAGLRAQLKATAPTAEEVAASERYQESIGKLGRAAERLGQAFLTFINPAIIAVADSLTKLFIAWNIKPGSPEAEQQTKQFEGKLRNRFGRPPKWLSDALGIPDSAYESPGTTGPSAPSAPSSPIPIKPNAGAASPATQRLMDVLSTVGGVAQVTALNDAYHRLLGGGAHPAGNALDLTIKDPSKSAEVTAAIRAKLSEMGIDANVIDEYTNPSRHSTGGHIHVGLRRGGGAGITAPGAPAAAASNISTSTRGGDNTTNNVSITVNAPGGDKKEVEEGVVSGMRRSGFVAQEIGYN